MRPDWKAWAASAREPRRLPSDDPRQAVVEPPVARALVTWLPQHSTVATLTLAVAEAAVVAEVGRAPAPAQARPAAPAARHIRRRSQAPERPVALAHLAPATAPMELTVPTAPCCAPARAVVAAVDHPAPLVMAETAEMAGYQAVAAAPAVQAVALTVPSGEVWAAPARKVWLY